MTLADKYLIKTYNKGWHDCSNNKNNQEYYKGRKKKAYELGWFNYIVGDEVTSVDSWSDERILAQIKNK